MRCKIHVRVQAEDFSVDSALDELSHQASGAQATFIGRVRDSEGDLISLELEHYPGMTEKALERMAWQAATSWPLQGITIIHRIGKLMPGQRIVLVATASAHRHDALAACSFLMDYLKKDAPFWKKETTQAGSHWVEARQSDQDALQRWEHALKTHWQIHDHD
ncbi:molybdenum cofactor biosynthesis protein MoaE [Burkholderiaceae bacterium DAT-1]|nr:molybdenum cofactor biosynthesis protein MoaE [Burkholderiaceae bacterium DAT-1]